jgi:hypothetical protein
VGEKSPERKAPSPLEKKPRERQIPDKTVKAIGKAAVKGTGKGKR